MPFLDVFQALGRALSFGEVLSIILLITILARR